MSNPWFRLYSEFASDHKMQMMSEAYQRRYVMLLCLRCSNGDVTLQDEEVAFQLRISNEEWAETKIAFVSKNLIDESNHVVAWDRRQFVSDSSAERVRKHREKAKQSCNVTVTPPDTDSEQIQNRTEKKNTTASVAADDPYFDMFWTTYDYKIDKHKALKAWSKIKPNGELAMKICQAADRYVIATPERAYRRHPTTWLNNRSWENEIVNKQPQQPNLSHAQATKLAASKTIFGDLSHEQRIIDVTPAKAPAGLLGSADL